MKIVIICMAILTITQIQPQDSMKEVRKNNMTVSWKMEKEYIQVEMEAPTNGWVAIGFNKTTSLTGTYLLMGRIRKGKAEVVEHYTEKPGNYKPIADLGVPNQVISISGHEKGNLTKLKFSIPISKSSKYHKQLSTETKWTLLLAYSVDDDFQHHSIMRTSMEIIL
ncbi:MAG: DOMON domain-containing protein [Reichenbachiella sp.]|uniref:DOMON domain-containing protein n=1 Tax=Reichenbachiella sp. TaxID=2184521 RepID=UPI002966F79D|nr:DOMON domain-containing protein [Reichenbachiella sp.]MDW3209100.1 DOMON domain-containing protein [Reichenbachiella sp.]